MKKPKEYEFGKKQTRIIKNLSKDMRFVGIFLNVVSGLSILGGFLEWWVDGNTMRSAWYIYCGILNIFIGIWTVNAATSFNLIARDRGSDITNLRAGVREVSKIYELQCWFFIVWLILIVGWLIFLGVRLMLSLL